MEMLFWMFILMVFIAVIDYYGKESVLSIGNSPEICKTVLKTNPQNIISRNKTTYNNSFVFCTGENTTNTNNAFNSAEAAKNQNNASPAADTGQMDKSRAGTNNENPTGNAGSTSAPDTDVSSEAKCTNDDSDDTQTMKKVYQYARRVTFKPKPTAADIAQKRFEIITPLLNSGLDNASRQVLRKSIAENTDISVRTLIRWEKKYQPGDMNSLMPKERIGIKNKELCKIYDEIMPRMKELKGENPRRSIGDLIYICEYENMVPYGVLKRSTLQKHMLNAGFGKKEMAVYEQNNKTTSGRFAAYHRMDLVQGDIKEGYGNIKSLGGTTKLYLSSLIDDHSRFILHSEWYTTKETVVVADTLRKAILKYGKLNRLYFDNGGEYKSGLVMHSCEQLGIRILRARPYRGQSKGKIEKFHQVVDKFLSEMKLKECEDLAELNTYWNAWLDLYYTNSSHAGLAEQYKCRNQPIPENLTPKREWDLDKKQLVVLDPLVVQAAFMELKRNSRVDKAGCVRNDANKYEANVKLAGKKVDVLADPMNKGTIYVFYGNADDADPLKCHPLFINEYCNQEKVVPESVDPIQPKDSASGNEDSSRHKGAILAEIAVEEARKQQTENIRRLGGILRFGGFNKNDDSDPVPATANDETAASSKKDKDSGTEL